MSTNPISDKELIEKFLRGELLEEEKFLFDSRKEDDSFLNLLETAVIAYKGRLALKERLQHIGEELSNEKSTPKRTSLYWISGIAAVLMLFFSVYFFSNQQLSSGELFGNYFAPYPNAYTVKGTTADKNLSKKALNYYDATKYQLAIETFEKIAAQRNLNSSEHFYYGISLLAMHKLEKAKTQFKKVTSQHPLYNEAQWYTSLSLIKQDSLAKAKTLLNNTRLQFSNSRKKNVQKLLAELP